MTIPTNEVKNEAGKGQIVDTLCPKACSTQPWPERHRPGNSEPAGFAASGHLKAANRQVKLGAEQSGENGRFA
jgi:hypothetical protein